MTINEHFGIVTKLCVVRKNTKVQISQKDGKYHNSPGYLWLYPKQLAIEMKPMPNIYLYGPTSHTKILGDSREWNIFFQPDVENHEIHFYQK